MSRNNPSRRLSMAAAGPASERHDNAPQRKRASELVALLRADPRQGGLQCELGHIFLQLGRATDAEKAFREAVRWCPDMADAYVNIGLIEYQRGNFDEAEVAYRRALVQDVDCVEAHVYLSDCLIEKRRIDEAHYLALRAAALAPDRAIAQQALGTVLYRNRQITEAIGLLERALDLDPTMAAAWSNLGHCHLIRGRAAQAQECFRKATDLDPNLMPAWDNLLFVSNFGESDRDEVFRLHQSFGELLAREGASAKRRFDNDRRAGRALKIGFVSSDLRQHSVGYFVEAALDKLDRSRFELVAYYAHNIEDDRTRYLKTLFSSWRPIYGVANREVAEMIRRDRIDVLLDLGGHTAFNRLPVFALRPAPVQISWIGYPNTTGLTTVDYRITDRWADPEGDGDDCYSEQLVRLPRCFLCYSPPDEAPLVAKPPCLSKRRITFGSFNSRSKIGDATLDLWGGVLSAVPESELLIKSAFGLEDDVGRGELLDAVAARGVAPERVRFTGMERAVADHLAHYGTVDICLDTYPYNGTTTTCEALWMGVPVVTLRGDRHVSRVGTSLLNAVGLDDLVAKDAAEFVAIAARLANDKARLTALRASMRERLSASPLFDRADMARQLEAALVNVWDKYCGRVSVVPSSSPAGSAGVPEPAAAVPEKGITVDYVEGSRLTLPRTLKCITTYVVLEQERWFERDVDFLCRLIGPGSVILDVGANVGAYAIPMASRAGVSGQVFAFEPGRDNREFLLTNVETNGLRNVTVSPAALSNRAGTGWLAAHSSGELHALIDHRVPGGDAEAVDVLSLDALTEQYDWPRVDLVKIDAEGHEARVVAGAAKFFGRYSPIVLYEIKRDSGRDDTVRWMFELLGYETFRLSGDSSMLFPLEREGEIDASVVNLFAVRPAQAELLEQRGLLAATADDAPLSAELRQQALDAMMALPFCAAFEVTAADVESCPFGDALLNYAAYRFVGRLSAGQRYGLLKEAYREIADFTAATVSPSALITLARIAGDFGDRVAAIEALRKVVALNAVDIDQPFFPALDRFESLPPSEPVSDWFLCAAHEALQFHSHYSSMFGGDLAVYRWLSASPYASAELHRRLALMLVSRRQLDEATEKSAKSAHQLGSKNSAIWAAGARVLKQLAR